MIKGVKGTICVLKWINCVKSNRLVITAPFAGIKRYINLSSGDTINDYL